MFVVLLLLEWFGRLTVADLTGDTEGDQGPQSSRVSNWKVGPKLGGQAYEWSCRDSARAGTLIGSNTDPCFLKTLASRLIQMLFLLDNSHSFEPRQIGSRILRIILGI